PEGEGWCTRERLEAQPAIRRYIQTARGDRVVRDVNGLWIGRRNCNCHYKVELRLFESSTHGRKAAASVGRFEADPGPVRIELRDRVDYRRVEWVHCAVPEEGVARQRE